MSITVEFANRLSTVFKEQGRSITTFLIVIVTSTLNQVLSKNFFKCPQQAHKEYGLCFLFGPALMLAMMTILFSFGTSTAMAGICKKDKDVPKEGKGGKRKRTWLFILRKTCLTLGQSLIAFACWIVLTLLTTDTYSCITIGPMPKSKTALSNYMTEKEKIDSHSKIAGFILLVACLAISMAMHFIVKCCYADQTQKPLPSMLRYDELEALAANKVFSAHMEAVAKLNGIQIAHEALGTTDCALKCVEDQSCILDSSVIEVKDIEEVRKFLALRYPRMDCLEDTATPYRKSEITWQKFLKNTDQCDGSPQNNTSDTNDHDDTTCSYFHCERVSPKGFKKEVKMELNPTTKNKPEIETLLNRHI